jgi:hypothetical protein
MHKNVIIADVGMVPFRKPGQSPSYDLMGAQAGQGSSGFVHIFRRD